MPLTVWLILISEITINNFVMISTSPNSDAELSSDFKNSIINNDKLENDGYFLDALSDIAAVTGPETFQCPSDNVITTRYKCNVNGQWVDCTRKHCCKDYIYILNKCIPKDQDPCQMNLCEQRCTLYLQRVICTCYEGYKFSPENQKKGITPVCVDIDECQDKNGDCEHECINTIGSYECKCRPGYVLRPDNRSCETETASQSDLTEETATETQAANRGHCYANCDTVTRLHEKVNALQEKVQQAEF